MYVHMWKGGGAAEVLASSLLESPSADVQAARHDCAQAGVRAAAARAPRRTGARETVGVWETGVQSSLA